MDRVLKVPYEPPELRELGLEDLLILLEHHAASGNREAKEMLDYLNTHPQQEQSELTE